MGWVRTAKDWFKYEVYFHVVPFSVRYWWGCQRRRPVSWFKSRVLGWKLVYRPPSEEEILAMQRLRGDDVLRGRLDVLISCFVWEKPAKGKLG